MPSISIAERLLTGDSLATMASPDWQSGEYATDYTKFLATTQQRLTSYEFKQRHPFTIGNRFYLRRLPISHQHTIIKGHPKPYECSQHRYSPTEHLRCNAPNRWIRILSTEADRSTQNASKMSDVFFVSLTSNTQRSLGNKIN